MLNEEDIDTFREFIRSRTQNGQKMTILTLVGSGLSASSGIRLYNTASDDNVWRNYSSIDLATLDAFDSNPAIVWLFYALRRHDALMATPNKGHEIISKLSNCNSKFNFLTITQNMDGLHQRSNHNPSNLLEFHGSLFKVRCTNFFCNYHDYNFTEPLTLKLDATKYEDLNADLPIINKLEELPLCPICDSLLRPGVIWFGESLPLNLIDRADEFIVEHNVDLLLIIGTSHSVWPTASYIDMVKNEGGKIAVFNTIKDLEIEKYSNTTKIWQFIGDCSVTLPKVFDSII